MIRPTSLLRNDSNREDELVAPAQNIEKDSLDCGIAVIPCCCLNFWQKFATPRVFIFVFIILGIIQGSAQAYFAATARHIGEIFNYSTESIDWLLVSNEIFQGIFVLFVAYWGNRIHRIAWLGGLTCFQGFSCFLVFVPYLEHLNNENNTRMISELSTNLCTKPNPFANLEIFVDEEEFCWITLIILFVLQLFIALANASFFTHGFSFIDDNVDVLNSPIYIAAALAVKMSTLQFGSFMAWSFLAKDRSWWIGYPILGSLLIVAGSIVATFPKSLINTLIKQAATSILNISVRNSADRHLDAIQPKTGFFSTFRRLITNKVIIINTIATVFLEMGIKNFTWYEEKFMEAQYYLPSVSKGFEDPWTSRLLITILKPPIMTLAMLVTGLVISKMQPRTRCLAIWCVLTTMVAVGACISYGFIDCKKDRITGEYKGKYTTPYCSHHCDCTSANMKFDPVCIQDFGGTYYNPCYAGCQNVTYINDMKFYSECSCGRPFFKSAAFKATLASEGACNNGECAIHWKMFQGLTIISSAFLGSGYVTNFMINLRAVEITDKAMAIGFELFLAGILVHVPGKILYKYISDSTCQYLGKDSYTCNLHNEQFGDIVSYLTAGLLFISAVFDFVVIFVSSNIDIFPDNRDDNSSLPMEAISRLNPRRNGHRTIDSGIISPSRTSRLSSNVGSGASTGAESIIFNSPEEQPLTRDELQRSLISELRSTQV